MKHTANTGMPGKFISDVLIRYVIVVLLFALPALYAQAEGPDYTLSPGDKVKITVFGHEDLSGEFEINATGTVSLPLIKDVEAAGKTVQELDQAITDKLQPDYLKNPRVNVQVMSFKPFYIIGEINQPGSYPYINDMTVIKAVALAGGYTYRARKNKITITRARDEAKGEQPANATTLVYPGDVIKVPERWF